MFRGEVVLGSRNVNYKLRLTSEYREAYIVLNAEKCGIVKHCGFHGELVKDRYRGFMENE